MRLLKTKKMLLGLLMVAAIVGCKKKDDPHDDDHDHDHGGGPGKATVGFELSNYAGSSMITSGTSYTTPQGETITISKFNYYISNIKIKKSDGTEYVEPDSYHLIQESVGGSKHFHIKDVPTGTYTGISFLIGVDSARNVSGAQTGALDPVNGMFWTWSTGYIMAKMEGTSPQSTETGNAYTFHIGGFNGANSALRTVTLNFPTQVQLTDGKELSILMKADALKWFAPNVIKIADKAEIMMPMAASAKIADNYANMFTITEAKIEQ